ncbi:MAG: L-2-amino-thiazoline-4-carboxylic acid hydrolase [Methanobacteriaceae archaeon]|nr:L-2-amino-thiazoline-4-carboxylic acid hydrolase [Methanobacteriaceae archaeon]
MTDYYTKQLKELLKEFENFNDKIEEIIAKKYGENFAKSAAIEIKKEYESLIPEIPYIGGEDNPLSITLELTTRDLAVYLVLKRMEKDVTEIGEICYQYADKYFQKNQDQITPMDNPQVIGLLRYMALESEKRKYSENFVYKFVEGEGKDFDFGLDYKECAICKFFHEKNADEFVPYMCASDIAESKYGGLGLQRTETLAEGGNKCDFRYKKGRKTRIASSVINEG